MRPSLAGVVILILAVIALLVVPSIKQDQLIPLLKESYLTIEIESTPATSQPEMNRIISRISTELRTILGVQNVGSHIGRAVFGDQVVGINSAELWLSIDRNADHNEMVTTIQEVVDGYPGISSTIGTYLQQTLDQSQENTRDGIVLRG